MCGATSGDTIHEASAVPFGPETWIEHHKNTPVGAASYKASETLFEHHKGLGQLIFDAFLKQDQFVVMAAVMMGCVMLMLGNLLADLLLAWSDPRIRLEEAS